MYEQIFDEIVEIMHNDYSGCNDKKGWDRPAYFKKQIQPDFSPTEFVDLVKDYLLDFKDAHMTFRLSDRSDEKVYEPGFKVRRYEDALYITEILHDQDVKIGEKIVSLDDQSISEIRASLDRMFLEKENERENWQPILMRYETAQLVDSESNQRTIELIKYEKNPYSPTYSIEKINDDTLFMTLTDFDDPDAIIQLIEQNEQLLNETKNLIIDVRINYGGSDGAFYKLLSYLFPEGETLIDLNEDYEMEYNCTPLNVETMVADINETLEQIEDQRMKETLQQLAQTLEENKGKGFVDFGTDTSVNLTGNRFPESIVVLADTYCGSAGDIFIEIVKMSPKVTVIGRPTAGLNDYANLTIKKWNDRFELWYPVSRLKRIDRGKGMTGIGIHPDVYIPWSPQHLEKDLDLEKAMQILKEKE